MSNQLSKTRNRLEGRVAQILNERELAINIGSQQGVAELMKFAVLSKEPVEIIDPESKQLLGTVDREKVRVEVIEVHPVFAICRTYKKKKVGGSGGLGVGAMIAAINSTYSMEYTPPREVPETLRAKESSLPRPLPPEESYVKIGDRIVQTDD